MDHKFNLDKLSQDLHNKEQYWTSFLEKDNFELGVMHFDPGQKDIQKPHRSDEVYFIINGDGYINIDGVDFEIKAKHAYYVPANTSHFFHGNTKAIIAYYALN